MRDNEKKFEKRGPRPEKTLTNRPMAGALQNVRTGPECLECRGPIDSRPGYSLSNPRGSRKIQRHGYLHPDCQLEAEKRRAQASLPGRPSVELQVLSLEDIQEILASRVQS